MRTHTQNLNDGKNAGSMFWHGRAWLRKSRGYDEIAHVEWCFGRHATSCSLSVSFGHGDSDAGILFRFCIPWLFSLYLSFPHIYRCKECELGFAIHNDAIWFYPLSWSNESNSRDPWWRKRHCWNFPWQYDWYSTEVLTNETPELAKTLYIEKRGDRKRKGIDVFDEMRAKEVVMKRQEVEYGYVYTLKSGVLQYRKATIHVERMTWRMRWWPLLPFSKVRTTLDVKFNDEVGEGTGSWKGGTVGCGYEMLPNEDPVSCLRRMERERKFDR